ncbi:MAG TPA: HEAT repeat domain-containing protein [Anaerolineales bacterium]|nr:HEAT repeat domain-containing protein [Anaerolineales bacterium]
MTEQITSFQTVLDSLTASGKDFPRKYLNHFSDIQPLELQTVLDVWERVNLDRKLSLLDGLMSLAGKDTLVSFDDFASAILNDPDASVRAYAIRLLVECDDVKLVPTYLELLKNDPDTNVRAEAAKVLSLFVDLGELEDIPEDVYAEVRSALLESAKSEKETRVRRRVLESLGWSSHPDVIALVESAFDMDENEWKASALIAMGRSANDIWEDRILRSLLDENNAIRKAAVQSAGMLPLKSARLPLLRMLEEEDNEDVMSAVIWSLSQIGGEDVQTYLEAVLDQAEEDELISFLEDALENLAFTEDLERFDLLAVDPIEVDDLKEIDGINGDTKEV